MVYVLMFTNGYQMAAVTVELQGFVISCFLMAFIWFIGGHKRI